MKKIMEIGNFFIRLILSSPLHGLMSKTTTLIHFTGRKSGKQYITPVNYTKAGSVVRITSQRERMWWRNLKSNPEVRLTLTGKEVSGKATVFEMPEQAAAGLESFLRPAPKLAAYYQINLNADGSFDQADLLKAAETTIVIEINLR